MNETVHIFIALTKVAASPTTNQVPDRHEALVTPYSAPYNVIMSHQIPEPANPANIPSARFFPHVGIVPGMRVLDVGCGHGDLSRLLAALAGPDGEIVGIDRSQDALTLARATPPEPGSAPIHYQAADLAGALPDLGRFNAIVGRRVLMYLPDAAATLARLARLARPGAILAFQEHARADLPSGAGAFPAHRHCYAMMWDTVAAEGGDVTLGYRLANLVRDAGFAIEQARSEAVLLQPWEASFLPTLARMMRPRMIAQGVTGAEDLDPDRLADRLDQERQATGGTIVWDLAFLVSGRFARET